MDLATSRRPTVADLIGTESIGKRSLILINYATATLTLLTLINHMPLETVSALLTSPQQSESEFLSLSLSSSSSGRMGGESQLNPEVQDSSAALQRIFNDEIANDFSQTEQAIAFIENALREFGKIEHLSSEEVSAGNLISRWLDKSTGGQISSLASKQMAEELSYLYATFWTKFRHLIQTIVKEQPRNLGIKDLAFRCERTDELSSLKQIASFSSLYGMTLDIFSSELYVHCLTRKLALIKHFHIEPSPILRQFVDIYLDLPPNYSTTATFSDSRQRILAQLQTNSALIFNPSTSVTKHGTLEAASELVLDPSSTLSTGNGQHNSVNLIAKFKRDCQQLTDYLSQVWSNFDELAAFLSSPFNDLVEFGARVKLAAPQLYYGSVCMKLIQAAR